MTTLQGKKQQTGGVRRWYVIHTYSGYEKAVARNLRQRMESIPGMKDLIFEVLVPSEQKVQVKGGKRIEQDENVFPGYVLVNMIVTDESWYVVRNTPRVTGFVGAGTQPVPLTEAEFARLSKRMAESKEVHVVDFAHGDHVRIIDGPFKEMDGVVEFVDAREGKVRVLVNMFGRETSVELDFLQVKKI